MTMSAQAVWAASTSARPDATGYACVHRPTGRRNRWRHSRTANPSRTIRTIPVAGMMRCFEPKRFRSPARQTAAVTRISIFHSGLASAAWMVARAGVCIGATHFSQTSFMAWKSPMSAR